MTDSLWFWVVLASVVALATKLVGYLLPAHWLRRPEMAKLAGAMTVGMLAALVTINAFADGTQLVLDARVGALAVAALILARRAPFLLVVVAGAATSAALRWFFG